MQLQYPENWTLKVVPKVVGRVPHIVPHNWTNVIRLMGVAATQLLENWPRNGQRSDLSE